MTKMITVKFLSKLPDKVWYRQFPDEELNWGQCRFVFDKTCDVYDWLVVYDDTPPMDNERFSNYSEQLTCPKEHTLLVTQEPHPIKVYGESYTHQFAHVLTSQTEKELPHPGRIYSQPALLWFYGMGQKHLRSFNEIAQGPKTAKQQDLSVVWSNKRQRHTTLYQRYRFLTRLKQELAGMEIFGAGHTPLDDKAEALDPFRYHIAIENHVSKHHWTEKIADAFLGGCLPFYHGCPNLDDYFPRQSFIPIDIFAIEPSIKIIKQAIAGNEYEKRATFIEQARQRVLYDFNLFAVIASIIDQHHDDCLTVQDQRIFSRRAANRKSLGVFIQHQWNKQFFRLKYSLKNLMH